MPQAILFDLDSTIITWELSYEEVWDSACRRFENELGDLTPEAVYKAIRSTSDWYWSDSERHRLGRLVLNSTRREIVKTAFQKLGRDNPDLAIKISDIYTELREQEETVTPEALATLEYLKKRGFRLALVTNGGADIQRRKIDKFNLTPYFDHIQIEGEFGMGKPEERVFLNALEKLEIKPADAWMVGDDLKYDIAPCRNLGMYTLWVNFKYGDIHTTPDAVQPDIIIKDISAIPGLL